MKIKEILEKYNRVHILGISPKKERDSNKVANYLLNHGFEITGIRPGTDRIGKIEVYPSIEECPGEIEILDVFRASEAVPAIVDSAIAKKVKVLWLQLGVTHPEAEEKARKAGITVISDECIKIKHSELFT